MSRSINPTSSRRSWPWAALITLVAVFGLTLVFLARGGDDVDPEVAARQVSERVDVTGTALPAYDGSQAVDPGVGATLPTISGTSFDGEPMTIEPDGRAKLVMVVAHWCPHCEAEVPRVVEHLGEAPLPDDVDLVAVSTKVRTNGPNYPPEEWLADNGFAFPVLADSDDGAASLALGGGGFPRFVAVDADGVVVARSSGEISTDEFDGLVAAARGTAEE